MIYLIRHGEAAASWGSHPDPGLSENGQAQAEAVAKTLSGASIQRMYSSPMQRCQETGQAFARASGLDLVTEPRVTEIPTPPDVENRVSWLRSLMAGSWGAAPDLVQAWRKDLIAAVSALPANTAVFTHFVAINALVGHLEETDLVTVFRPNYCSLTILEQREGQLRLQARGESLETKVL